MNYLRERFSCLVTAVDISDSDSFVPVVVCSQGNWWDVWENTSSDAVRWDVIERSY